MRILSINGGGSLGYITALFLREIEEKTRIPLFEQFDLIAGVSTGSLIAAALACGKSASEICEFYELGIPKIFDKSHTFIVSLFKSKYNNKNLIKCISDVFGELTINKTLTKLLVSSVCLTGSDARAKFWKSWEDSELLCDCLIASCSAPTYFDPYKIGEDYFIDGGLATNNLSMCAVADAIKLGYNRNDIKVLNIACLGRWAFPRDFAKNMDGVTSWIKNAIEVATHSTEAMAYYQISQIIDKHMLVQANSKSLLDSTDMNKLKKESEYLLQFVNPTVNFLLH
jgi:patatin-like phospholipase/acyl hydrolase